jgi:hypothetical protein
LGNEPTNAIHPRMAIQTLCRETRRTANKPYALRLLWRHHSKPEAEQAFLQGELPGDGQPLPITFR